MPGSSPVPREPSSRHAANHLVLHSVRLSAMERRNFTRNQKKGGAMRRAFLCALVSALAAPVAHGQQPVGTNGSRPSSGPAVQVQPWEPVAPDQEIQALKAAMLQMQERLNQLAPPPRG